MNGRPRVWAVVPAAGAGRRMGGALPKQYLELNGKPLLEHTLRRLLGFADMAGLVLVVAESDERWGPVVEAIADERLQVARGGAERCHSVLNGLRALAGCADGDDWAMVHDAARPCVRHADLERLLAKLASEAAGGLLGIPVRDTMKRTDDAGHVTATVDRDALWHALTPQVFRYRMLLHALEDAVGAGVTVTDEAAAMERAGHRPLMVEGCGDNIKVTRPEDLILAGFYLQQQEQP